MAEQRSKKIEKNRHGAVSAGCGAESDHEALYGTKIRRLSRPDTFKIQICKHHKMYNQQNTQAGSFCKFLFQQK